MKNLIEPIGVLMEILKRHTDKGKRKPKMFPGTVREAAQYWIDHQEPPDDYKEAVTKIIKNGELIGYETPYHDRLARTLRAFLKEKEIYQVAIIEAIERGIPWRGDEMYFFTKLIKEADVFMKDPEAYKAKHSETMRRFV